jgi:hypothetical protein
MAVLGAVLALAGCATGKDSEVQRATEGPTAEEIYMARFVGDYGRLPTFDETLAFRAAVDDRVAAYLSRHPDLSTSTRASQFTFHRRAAVGMTRDEVSLLLGDGDGRPPVLARRRPARAGDVDVRRRVVSLLRRRSPGRHHGDRQAAALAA